jgi:glycine hydroxymethyltransferase
MGEIARWLDEVVEAARGGESDVFARVKSEVNDLMERYPAPGCRSSAVAPAALPH